MEKKKKFCITFAGAVGSSKTPIAYYLSQKFGLPMINNDVIRTEVTEDLLQFNQEEYEKRRNERAKEMLERGISFIFDASVDREWDQLHEWFAKHDYQWFIISLDFSREFLEKLYKVKGYDESLAKIETLLAEHQTFLDQHGKEIGLHLTDEDFPNRLELSHQAVKNWLK